VTANRRKLLRAIDTFAAGGTLPARGPDLSGPPAVDTIAPSADWEATWRRRETERREASPWAGRVGADV
jgi:phthalate 4,5-dioxygenase oxygenase subunit